jgi:hypothetical protein
MASFDGWAMPANGIENPGRKGSSASIDYSCRGILAAIDDPMAVIPLSRLDDDSSTAIFSIRD